MFRKYLHAEKIYLIRDKICTCQSSASKKVHGNLHKLQNKQAMKISTGFDCNSFHYILHKFSSLHEEHSPFFIYKDMLI